MSFRIRGACCVFALSLGLGAANTMSAQQPTFATGQNVVPVFEGWERNSDGTFNMVFGYLNRNYEEEINISLGPNNIIEPAGLEQTQPTHFYPRRNRFVFRVKVPKDWGSRDVVWTLTAYGRTEKAYGSLLPVEIINDQTISMNNSGGGSPDEPNKPPTIKIVGATKRTITLGEPLTLNVVATDDGVPKPRPAPQSRPPGRRASLGLRVVWIQWRGGPGKVTFDPDIKPYSDPASSASPWTPGWTPPPIAADGTVVTKASFSEPGSYVLRVIGHDGYLSSMSEDVVVTVNPPASAQVQH